MRKAALFGLASLAVAAFGSTGHAAAVIGHDYTVSDSTGPMSFIISDHSGFSRDVVDLGSQRSALIGSLAYNGSLGPNYGGIAHITWSGDPFKVVYSVEGFGNEMVFSDTVTVTAKAYVNGSPIGSPEIFNVNLSSSCGGVGQADVDRFCSTKQLLASFTDSQSLPLPPNTSVSQVQFYYDVTQSNENCVENYYTGSVITTTSACTQGGTSIIDTNNLFDPSWHADISVTYFAPEPASFGLLAAGLGLLTFARRRPVRRR